MSTVKATGFIRFATLILVLILAFALLSSCGTDKEEPSTNSDSKESSSSANESGNSGADWQKAIDVATEELDIQSSDIIFSNANLANYRGQEEAYKVVLKTEEMVYEIWVSASDFSILATESEKNRESATAAAEAGYITLDEAKEAAVKQAGVSVGDVNFTKEALDEDDGVMVYRIDFIANNKEYETRIDPTNGDVLKFEIDD